MLLNYDPNEDGKLAHYIADEHGGEQFKQLAAEIDRADELAQKEQRIAELESALQEMPSTIEEQAVAVVRDLKWDD